MSLPISQRVPCEQCGHDFQITVWQTINTGDRELVKKFLDGELNVIRCPRCNWSSFVPVPILINDLDRNLWLWVYERRYSSDASLSSDGSDFLSLHSALGGETISVDGFERARLALKGLADEDLIKQFRTAHPDWSNGRIHKAAFEHLLKSADAEVKQRKVSPEGVRRVNELAKKFKDGVVSPEDFFEGDCNVRERDSGGDVQAPRELEEETSESSFPPQSPPAGTIPAGLELSARERYEQVIARGVRDAAFIHASLDLAENVAKHFARVIDAYLQYYRSPAIPPKLASSYSVVSPRMLMYGLFTHFICFGSDYRDKFQMLDEKRLWKRWNEMAVRALSIFSSYSKDHQGVPEALFLELYALDAEPSVRDSGVWWGKRMRIQSAIRDRFATGVVLGMAVDMMTANK
jgi:hypothetical protein